MKIEFPKIEYFRKKMIESFRSGVVERFGNADAAPIPPEDDLLQSSPNATPISGQFCLMEFLPEQP